MIANESRYPLAKLQLDVPEPAQAYGRSFEALLELALKAGTEHPLQFGKKAKQFVEAQLCEAVVKGFFNAMGDELSRQAKLQWRS